MASGQNQKRKTHHSPVADVIEFVPDENPSWRRKKVPPVTDMIADIVRFQEEWNSMKENRDAGNVQRKFLQKFIYHCNNEEETGCKTLEKTEKCLTSGTNSETSQEEQRLQQETIDLRDAYQYLMDVKEKEEDSQNQGLIEESMLRKANKIIRNSAPTRPGCTKFGVYSDNLRFTTFEGETYEYQQPEDMHNAVNTILDRFNSLYEESQNTEAESQNTEAESQNTETESQNTETESQNTEAESQDSQADKKKRLCNLFKACSWLVFEMLDLHPFGDGNGRLCRLLCSYVLSRCTPFPTPIYNIWSESSKYDYKTALKQARKSEHRHPQALATMIIECSWHGWAKFLNNMRQTPAAATDESASEGSSQTYNVEEDTEEVSSER